MARVRVIVEGQTEESFVMGPMRDYLSRRGVYLGATLIGKRGGDVTYQRVRRDAILTLKQDQGVFCTTLIDFYGLGRGFPPAPPYIEQTAQGRAAYLEQMLYADISKEIPENRPDKRFIPYIQLHEFEALLFSDVRVLAEGMFRPDLAHALQTIRNEFGSPEEIDDGPATAPSKRLLSLHAGYDKVISGGLAAEAIGIDRMMQECPRFRAWVERLTSLPTE